MTSLLASRRRAEEFARHLDDRRTSHDPNLAPLLELTARLRPTPIEPAPDFCATLRDHLLTVAADLPAAERVEPAPDRTGTRLVPTRIRVTGMATAFAAASVLVAVAVMARGALPGDALYPVKLRLEGAQVAVATNTESRGHQYLAQSEHRLNEIAGLLDGKPLDGSDSRVRLVENTLNNFAREFRTGATLLTQVYRTEGRTAPLNRVREFAATASGRLATMGPLLPSELRPAYDKAMEALAEADQDALTICPACGPDEQVGDPDGDERPERTDPHDKATEPEASTTTETRTPGQTVSPDDTTTSPGEQGRDEPLLPTITLPGIRLPEGLGELGLPLPSVLTADLPMSMPTAIALPAVLGNDSSGDDSGSRHVGEGAPGEETSSRGSKTPDPSDSEEPKLPTSSATSPDSDDPPPRISLKGILEGLRLPFL